MKTLACSDMGIDCSYVATKPTAEEVKSDLMEHAGQAHSDILQGMSEQGQADMMRQMDERMRDLP